MDEASWPTDHRQLKKARTVKGRGKDKTKEGARDYPCLEHGSLNALTLSSDNGRLKWAAIVGTSKGNILCSRAWYMSVLSDKRVGKKLEGRGDAQKIFPATRPFPLRIPNTSVSQRAEQGVCFPTAAW